MPISVDGRPGIGARAPPRTSNEQFSVTSTRSSGRATSHGSGRRSQLSGLLPLPAVLDRLPEHAVLVAEPVAHGGQLHRRHRVEEAGREPPEAAVAEAGVGLLLEEAEPVEVLLRDDLLRDRIEQQVHDVVRERAADQELHRQVVDALRVLALVGLLGAHPSLGQDVAHRARERLEALARSGGRGIEDAVEDEMALVERIGAARELDGAAAVLLEKVSRMIAPLSVPTGIRFD